MEFHRVRSDRTCYHCKYTSALTTTTASTTTNTTTAYYYLYYYHCYNSHMQYFLFMCNIVSSPSDVNVVFPSVCMCVDRWLTGELSSCPAGSVVRM